MFPFFPKTIYDPMFSKGFLGNQGFSTKTKIKLVFVLTNNFWKFKRYPNHTTSKPEEPKHHESTSKLSFSCMNNEKLFCIFT
jgi:hypothetical protein